MSTQVDTQAHKIGLDVCSQPLYYTDALPISYLFNHTVNTLPLKMKHWGIETHESWVNPESPPSFLSYSLRVGMNPMTISCPAFLFSSLLYISLLCLSCRTPPSSYGFSTLLLLFQITIYVSYFKPQTCLLLSLCHHFYITFFSFISYKHN